MDGSLLLCQWRDQVILGLKALYNTGYGGFKTGRMSRRKCVSSFLIGNDCYPICLIREVLVVNNLVALILWHKVIALTPPSKLKEEIQRTILELFWVGKPLVKAANLKEDTSSPRWTLSVNRLLKDSFLTSKMGRYCALLLRKAGQMLLDIRFSCSSPKMWNMHDSNHSTPLYCRPGSFDKYTYIHDR